MFIMRDEHVMETLGKARVVVRDGVVVEVSEPRLDYCPLFHKRWGVEHIDAEFIRGNIQQRIDAYGLFTERRDIEQESFVGFGTSEIFMTALKRDLLDAVVTVCEGAGTVITANPALVQGIGARLSGIVSTTPIPGLIARIAEAGGHVLFPDNATIDQVAGVRWALEKGYRSVGVSLVAPEDAKRCKALSPEGSQVVTFLVHTSGEVFSKEGLRHFDLVTACASRSLWEVLEGAVKVQAGKSIPIFALSQQGKELLLERAKAVTTPLILHGADVPLCAGRQPEPLF
jgi:putative methanogenesis marker protein 8